MIRQIRPIKKARLCLRQPSHYAVVCHFLLCDSVMVVLVLEKRGNKICWMCPGYFVVIESNCAKQLVEKEIILEFLIGATLLLKSFFFLLHPFMHCLESWLHNSAETLMA